MSTEEQILAYINAWQNSNTVSERQTLINIAELFDFCRGHNIYHDGFCPVCERVNP